jgi:hypothetical protein
MQGKPKNASKHAPDQPFYVSFAIWEEWRNHYIYASTMHFRSGIYHRQMFRLLFREYWYTQEWKIEVLIQISTHVLQLKLHFSGFENKSLSFCFSLKIYSNATAYLSKKNMAYKAKTVAQTKDTKWEGWPTCTMAAIIKETMNRPPSWPPASHVRPVLRLGKTTWQEVCEEMQVLLI